MNVEVDLDMSIDSTSLHEWIHINEQISPKLTNATISVADVTALGDIAKLKGKSNNHR